jgi:hypothetical protein
MDEYISKEELLKHLNECRNDPLFDPDMARICFAISIFVENMKSADVQPVVHGKWDTHDVVKVLCSGKTLDGFCQCEACGDVFPLAYSEYNYCPNCGARMDLKEGDAE